MLRFDVEFFGGVMVGLVLGIAAMILLMPRLAHGQEVDRIVTACKTEAGPLDRQWSWRIIDGKKCWYAGPHYRDRSLLYWREPEPEPVIERIVEPPPPVETIGERVRFPSERWWPDPMAQGQ